VRAPDFVNPLANQLPAEFLGDTCDRLIGATVLAEGIALVTRDEGIRACKQIKTIW
jgi:PIN domain nuclease of toxin-antitoxin system